MIEKAKFRYSAQKGILELEGSEEFVSKHFDSLTDLIRIISRHVVVEAHQEPSEDIEPTNDNNNSPRESAPHTSIVTVADIQKEGISMFPEHFAEINGKLKIVSDIPGSTLKAKMTNAAILFCYGSKLLGDETISSKDIRSVCEEHGCLDSPNFSKVFTNRTIFLSDGIKGGNKNIKLTFQGEKKARELLGCAQS